KKELMSGKRLRLYCGFDPSADSLHIGNAIQVNKMSQFQELGHEVIFLVGDFTGMIGDPTDKAAARKKLNRKEVLENSKHYQEQASAYLDFEGSNKALVKYNSEWSDKVSFKDLIEICSNFTVQQMIQRDMFQERIKKEKPIYLHEFLYPVAQGYDSVAMDVDLEVGGNDQMFNMLAGRDLQKAINNKEKYVITHKLIADDEGNKMGKSEGNAVFLSAKPKDIYGIIMSWSDGVIGIGLELCTKLPWDEIKKDQETLKQNKVNPRDLKMKLAFEITKQVHGENKAKEAQDNFIKTIQRKEIPDEINELKPSVYDIMTVLVEAKAVSSKSEGRRVIAQGGVKINKEKISDLDIVLKAGDIVQKGKVFFVKIK
ncbi:MAG: tyrosine--tRNA ligase, partial [Patescibacteria group bacterium]|nr:tyrosine--tRNA ligase [Patescibacteria group bacterium]